MPIIRPHPNESENQFISRCMTWLKKEGTFTNNQWYPIAQQQWMLGPTEKEISQYIQCPKCQYWLKKTENTICWTCKLQLKS